jgi:hypothetical protein
MKISLEQNTTSNPDVPCFVQAEITSLTIDTNSVFKIPVYQYTNGKTTYNTELCGFRVEASSPDELLPLTDRLLRGLVNMARLPTYIFIARRSQQMYPVYTIGDEVLATTPGGPVFRHVELANVRDYLADYLHAMGELGTPGKSDRLHVRGVNMNTLALIRPIFYLKKRAMQTNEHEFWAPVFMADDGKSIYTYAASGKREVDLSGGYEALLLRTQVAQALIADQRLKENFDLRPDRLLPDYWTQVKATLKPMPVQLVAADLTMDVYRNGRGIVAVEHRQEEDRYSLYIGEDLADLRRRAANILIRRGLLTRPDELAVMEGVA